MKIIKKIKKILLIRKIRKIQNEIMKSDEIPMALISIRQTLKIIFLKENIRFGNTQRVENEWKKIINPIIRNYKTR